MTNRYPSSAAALILAGGLSACADTDAVTQDDFTPDYLGAETEALDTDLVKIVVEMQGARDGDDIVAYADCAAANYALQNDFGFVRHIRTNIANEGSVWRGDAVYTISPALPRGLRTIDAEVLVENCAETGIPTG